MGVNNSKVTVRKGTSLTTIAAALADEKVHRQILMDAVALPTLELMKQRLEPHRRSHPSAVDSIGIVAPATKVGFIQVAVGAIGDNALEGGDVLRAPAGGKDEGWKLRFLENGTIKQAATPWARPALDEIEPTASARCAALMRERMPSLIPKGGK
jgi:hypothetical protein